MVYSPSFALTNPAYELVKILFHLCKAKLLDKISKNYKIYCLFDNVYIYFLFLSHKNYNVKFMRIIDFSINSNDNKNDVADGKWSGSLVQRKIK